MALICYCRIALPDNYRLSVFLKILEKNVLQRSLQNCAHSIILWDITINFKSVSSEITFLDLNPDLEQIVMDQVLNYFISFLSSIKWAKFQDILHAILYAEEFMSQCM